MGCVPREMPIMIGRLQFWLWSGLAIGAFICVGLVFATLGMGVERLVINFGVGSAFGILGMIFLCIMMPESLNKQERMGFKIKNAFPCSTFFVMSRNNFTRVMWVGFWMTAGFAIGGAEVVLATWFVLRFQLAVYFVLGGKNGLTDYLAVLFSVLALNWLMQGLGNAVMVKPYMAVFKNDFKKVFTVAGFFTFMGFFTPRHSLCSAQWFPRLRTSPCRLATTTSSGSRMPSSFGSSWSSSGLYHISWAARPSRLPSRS